MELISEFGLFGVLIDPIIVQVPANATVVSATYSGVAGSGALEVTNVTGGLRADATTRINPEPGQRLVVLDFPTPSPLIAGQTYDFSLDLSLPGQRDAGPAEGALRGQGHGRQCHVLSAPSALHDRLRDDPSDHSACE